MAKIFIDPHMFSEDWFKGILKELLESEKVTFVYGDSAKHRREIQRVRQAVYIYKVASEYKRKGNRKKVVVVSADESLEKENFLESQECYNSCSYCDDPHIFSIVYIKCVPFVFSKDDRIAKCRTVINKKLDKKYCQFSLIKTIGNYNDNKRKIHF